MTYRIGKLAKKIGVNEHTLRYYEKEGLVVPQRDENNIRITRKRINCGLNLSFI